MLLMIQHNKPYPDTMLNFFGSLDEYRYELYIDLKRLKKMDKFPAMYNNHPDLGRSSLMNESSYDKPDTLVYIDRLPAEYKSKKGFIYFYKYKIKKEDLNWKLAMVGLTPEDPKQFEYEDSVKLGIPFNYSLFSESDYNMYNFTALTDTKIEVEEPISKQLNKALKKALYSRRQSAREFYEEREQPMTSPVFID